MQGIYARLTRGRSASRYAAKFGVAVFMASMLQLTRGVDLPVDLAKVWCYRYSRHLCSIEGLDLPLGVAVADHAKFGVCKYSVAVFKASMLN